MDEPDRKLMGIVLCGGKSRRMGRDKAVLEADRGKSFLDIAVDRLGRLCQAVYVSTNTEHDVGNYPRIADPPDSKGPISGILAALRSATLSGFDACIFNPVDTPNLSVDELQLLVKKWNHNPDRIVCAESLRANVMQLEPLISIIPVVAESDLQSAMERGEYSLWRTFQRSQPVTISLPAESCLNINSPADLEQFRTDR